ncbi:MAG: thioredoxin family protein [Rikenellaceae bacterium]|nr:thioredoxin family protein [Rikenellaceae bacterium]
MKKLMLMLAFAGLTTIACAQSGVQFQEKSMAELMKESQEAGKPIFVDMYTTWCGPCKYMANNVFTQPKAGEFFNAEFINAKFDAEKGEGIQLAQKYQVNVYPPFLILDASGKEIGRIVGGDELDGFIQKVKDAVK